MITGLVRAGWRQDASRILNIYNIHSCTFGFNHSSLSPMIPLLQSVFQICELLQESCIWSDISVLSDQFQSLNEK